MSDYEENDEEYEDGSVDDTFADPDYVEDKDEEDKEEVEFVKPKQPKQINSRLQVKPSTPSVKPSREIEYSSKETEHLVTPTEFRTTYVEFSLPPFFPTFDDVPSNIEVTITSGLVRAGTKPLVTVTSILLGTSSKVKKKGGSENYFPWRYLESLRVNMVTKVDNLVNR